jgi:hypothetical protein
MQVSARHRSPKGKTYVAKTPIKTETKPEFGGIVLPMGGLTKWPHLMSTYQAAWQQQQWWGFVSDRLSKDVALVHQLVSCNALEDVARIYTAFFTQAMDDYQKEIARLTEMGTEVTAATAPVVPDGYDALDLKDIDMLCKLNA